MESIGELYKTEEVAASLKVSIRTILRAIESGKLKAKKIGKGYRISEWAVREFWEKTPYSSQR